MKLSKPRNDKPKFEIPGRGPLLAGSGILAVVALAGLLSGPPSQPPPQPPSPPPARRAPASEPASTAPPAENEPSPPPESPPGSECVIKGNISKNDEHIYHIPGQWDYDRTVITPKKGERWFCTEEEARAAGWRKARR